jgi:CBS domain-containing protein
MTTIENGVDEKEREILCCIQDERLSALQLSPSVCVDPNTLVREVIQTMIEQKAGAVSIVENGNLIGIFSERDIVQRVALDYEEAASQPIRGYMTLDPVRLSIHDKIAFALNRMDVGGYRQIPIIDEQNQPMRMAAVSDIIRFMDIKCLGGAE